MKVVVFIQPYFLPMHRPDQVCLPVYSEQIQTKRVNAISQCRNFNNTLLEQIDSYSNYH